MGMLPRSTGKRMRREAAVGKQSGRTSEIQRIIGRSLRAVVDLNAMGECQILIDCDVIQADGGTRTAAITGSWVALNDCVRWMISRNVIQNDIIKDHVAAISTGIYNRTPILDLDYHEDSDAETDANFVMTGSGELVEIQSTAEEDPYTEEEFLSMLELAKQGIEKLVELQKMAIV